MQLPQGFKDYCAIISINTSSIQYESDDLMRPYWGDDYGIACCVSAMRVGKQMQFFGARANLAKTLLYAINGGRDELSGEQIGPTLAPVTADVLDFEDVRAKLGPMMDWLAKTYMGALNAIHYSHDKYMYERVEMALHDRDTLRTMACGIAAGFLGLHADDYLLADVDLVLLDIKAFSEKTYRDLTGVTLQPTLDFARRLAAMNKPVWIRYVLVPGLTDRFDEIEGLAAFLRELGNIERVDVLPFHKMGEFKWEQAGEKYRLTDTPPPSRELLRRTRAAFSNQGWSSPDLTFVVRNRRVERAVRIFLLA